MSGRAGRYLAGLCVAALALTAGGWLVLTPYAFGFRGRARLTAFGTGGCLVAVAVVTLACWALLWRRRLRADGVLKQATPIRSRRSARRSARRQARAERLVKATRRREIAVAPDPARVLTDLRELLTPLLADQSLGTDRVVVRDGRGVAPEDAAAAQDAVAAEEAAEIAPEDAERVSDTGHLVQVPGQLRGSRSASFLSPELLTVGSGEEESW